MYKEFKQLIRDLIFSVRYKRSVKKANRMAARNGKAFYVLVVGKKLRVMSMEGIDNLLKTGVFARYVTRYTLRARAIYATPRYIYKQRKEAE